MKIRSLLCAALSLFALASAASNGALDTGFNAPNGWLSVSYTGSAQEDLSVGALLRRPDGSVIYAATRRDNAPFGLIELDRILPNGQIDPLYFSSVQTGTAMPRVVSMARQSSGRMLLLTTGVNAGASDFALYRLEEGGGTDEGFGPGGRRLVTFTLLSGAAILPTDVLVDANDRIILIGTYGASSGGALPVSGAMVAVRLDADGAPDVGFGPNGNGQIAITRFAQIQGIAPSERVERARIGADGQITLAGFTAPEVEIVGGPGPGAVAQVTAKIAIARLRSDGSLAPGFGNGGVVVFDPNLDGVAGASGLALESDGRAVVVANRYVGPSSAAVYLYRFGNPGDLDFGYGTLGRATIVATQDGAPWPMGAAGVMTDGAGRMIVFGSFVYSGISKSLVGRLTASGMPDPGFGPGTNGTGLRVLHTPAGASTLEDLSCALMDGDRILLGGRHQSAVGGGRYQLLFYRLAGVNLFRDGFE
jgi:uncharacterized delta-60 repeat protein